MEQARDYLKALGRRSAIEASEGAGGHAWVEANREVGAALDRLKAVVGDLGGDLVTQLAPLPAPGTGEGGGVLTTAAEVDAGTDPGIDASHPEGREPSPEPSPEPETRTRKRKQS